MSNALGFVSLLIGLVVVAMYANRLRPIAVPLLVGFALRALVAVFDAEVLRLPGQDDSYRFDYLAWYWARNGLAGTFEHLSTGTSLYIWLISAFYAVFDRSPLMMQGINVLFGALIIVNAWRLALAIGGTQRQAAKVAWLVALYPSLAFFSAILLREIVVAYPVSLGVYHMTVWQKDRRPADLVIAVAALLVSMAFHSAGFAVLLAAAGWLAASAVRSAARGKIAAMGWSSVGLLAAGIAIAFAVSSGFGMEKFQAVESGELAELGAAQSRFAHGRTAYLGDLHAEGPTDLIWQAPLRLGYFLFAPFPWMLSAPADVIGVVDSLFFFYLCVRAWRSRHELRENRSALFVLAIFGAMAFTFALGVSNYGTAHRHRNKMLPLLIAATMVLSRRRQSVGPGGRARARSLPLRAATTAAEPSLLSGEPACNP